MKKKMVGPMLDHDYQAEDDHRTLTRAAEIQDDHSRMAGVRRHHQKQTKALGRMHALLHGGPSPSKRR